MNPPHLASFLPLAVAPNGFFMTLRDVMFWLRSARADSRLQHFKQEHGAGAGSAFDRLYAAMKDPFGAELPQYRYQQRKYDSLLSMLPARSYRHALDIGCGLGAFTRKLAPFVGQVLGTDISAVAITQARELSLASPNILYSLENMLDVPLQAPAFDLIVLADTLYYVDPLTENDLQSIAHNIASRLTQDGLLLLVHHYFFGIDAASRTTRMIHDAFRHSPLLECVSEHRRAFFLATLLRRSAA